MDVFRLAAQHNPPKRWHLRNGRLVPPPYRKPRPKLTIHDFRELMRKHPPHPPNTVWVSVETMEVLDDMLTNWDTKYAPMLRRKRWETKRRRRRTIGRGRW